MKPAPLPEAARLRVEELLATDGLNSGERELLETLKKDRATLREAVWPRLARGLPGRESEVIDAVVIAFRQAHTLWKDPPKLHGALSSPEEIAVYQKWLAERMQGSLSSAGELAFIARYLSESMTRMSVEFREIFNFVWTGDPNIDFDKVISIASVVACSN